MIILVVVAAALLPPGSAAVHYSTSDKSSWVQILLLATQCKINIQVDINTRKHNKHTRKYVQIICVQ